MGHNGSARKVHSVSVDLGEFEGVIERTSLREAGPVKIRILCRDQGRALHRSLELTEKDLVDLLQKAIRAGILSPEFLENLHSEFEI